MKKRFDTKILPAELKKMAAEANKNGTWLEVNDFLDENSGNYPAENEDIALLFAFSKVKSAMDVHVDDVYEFAEEALQILKPFEMDDRGYLAIADIKRIKSKEKRKRNQIAKWAKLDINTLTLDQQKNAAYQLSSSTDLESLKKSAELFYAVYIESNNLYYYCCYANLLFKSKQEEKAFVEYEKILAFDDSYYLENHDMFICTIYENLLDYHKENKEKFYELWKEALSNSFIKAMEQNYTRILFIFPLSIRGTETIFAKAMEYELYEICNYLKIKIDKDKTKVSKNIKEYVLK